VRHPPFPFDARFGTVHQMAAIKFCSWHRRARIGEAGGGVCASQARVRAVLRKNPPPNNPRFAVNPCSERDPRSIRNYTLDFREACDMFGFQT
jgi:hypothetical protein